MANDIRDILKNHPYLLDYYKKADLLHIKDIYFNHLRRKHVIADEFSFMEFVSKLHQLNYEPHKYSIIRYDTKKPFSENNMILKPADGLIRKLKNMSKIIEKNERHKVAITIKDEKPFQICLKHPNAKYERRIYIKQ